MIDHVWTVVCSHAVVDQYTNNVSLQHVVEQLAISAQPVEGHVLPIKLDIMTLWVRSDFEAPAVGQYEMVLRSPTGVIVVGPIARPVDLSEYRRSRDRIALAGLPLGQPGRYEFEVSYRLDDEAEWNRVAAIPLEVIFRPPQTGDSDDG